MKRLIANIDINQIVNQLVQGTKLDNFNAQKFKALFNLSNDYELFSKLQELKQQVKGIDHSLKRLFDMNVNNIYEECKELYPDQDFSQYKGTENPFINQIWYAFLKTVKTNIQRDAQVILKDLKIELSYEDKDLLAAKIESIYSKHIRDLSDKNIPLPKKQELLEECYQIVYRYYDQYEFTKYFANNIDATNFAKPFIKHYVDEHPLEFTQQEKYCFTFRKQIIHYLNKNIDSILTQMHFEPKSNGTIEYSWDDISHDDLVKVFNYFASNPQKLFNYLHVTQKSFETLTGLDLDQFFKKYGNLDMSELQVLSDKVRKYIIQLNQKVLSERSNMLTENDDSPFNIDIFADIEYENADRILNNINASATIDFSPENDCDRSKPIIVALLKEENKIKPTILYGNLGNSHSTVVSSNFDLLKKSHYDGKDHIGYAYLIGNVAFVDTFRGGKLIPVKQMVELLKKEPNINKVYTCDANNGHSTRKIYRLARLRVKK